MPSIQTSDMVPATIILTCGKCARKLDGGYGHKARESLKSALRTANREADPRPKLRFIETRCLGLCPKKAVAAINTAMPGRILAIPARTPGADALGTLLGRASPARAL